jgi:hypothetical protein
MDAKYVDEELSISDFFQLYAVALDLEEQRQYEQYILAGGDPKKFRWSSRSPDEPRATDDDLMGGILDFAIKSRIKPKRIDIADIASIQGDMPFAFQLPNGDFVDEDGNPIEPPPGYVFVKSKKASQNEATAASKQAIIEKLFNAD